MRYSVKGGKQGTEQSGPIYKKVIWTETVVLAQMSLGSHKVGNSHCSAGKQGRKQTGFTVGTFALSEFFNLGLH